MLSANRGTCLFCLGDKKMFAALGRAIVIAAHFVLVTQAELNVVEEPIIEEVVEEPVVEVVEEPYYEQSNDGWTYYGTCYITHYCPCSTCNGGYSGTASGAPLTPYRTAACSFLPFGTEVMINGEVWVIEDTGVSGDWIDLCMSSHDEAYARGAYYAEVYIR